MLRNRPRQPRTFTQVALPHAAARVPPTVFRKTEGTHRFATFGAADDAKQAAVDRVLENPVTRTADLGGSLGCKGFGAAVANVIEARPRG